MEFETTDELLDAAVEAEKDNAFLISADFEKDIFVVTMTLNQFVRLIHKDGGDDDER